MVTVLPAQLYTMGNGSSWQFAGALPTHAPVDGTGMQALFYPRVKQLCFDPYTEGYLLLEENGVLRWISALAEVTTLVRAESVRLVAFAGAPYTFILIEGTQLLQINVWEELHPGGGSSSSVDAPLLSISRYVPMAPLSLLFVKSQTKSALYVLDGEKLLRLPLDGVTPPDVFCGGGSKLFHAASVVSSMACSEVSLGASGAMDVLEYKGTLYILFYSTLWAGIAQIQEGQRLSKLLVFPTAESASPLRLMAGPDALYVALRSPPQILRVALSDQCQCLSGLYCNSSLCLEPPLGHIAPAPWTSTPVPCPLGSISVSPTQCAPCPPNFTTSQRGAWFCRPICEPDHFMDALTGECVPDCNASLGLYHDLRQGQCLPCWLGSAPSGGVDCVACPPGQYGSAPGRCTPCPPDTDTVMHGATRCMPRAFAVCADGGTTTTTCPTTPDTPSLVLEQALLPPPTGLVVWPNGTHVISYTTARVPKAYFTVPVPTLVWVDAKGTLFFGDIAAWESKASPIYHVAVMQSQGYVPVVYASTMVLLEEGTSACAEVYAISTHDRSVTRFMSQDLLKSPTILLSQCILQPIVLHVTASGMLYAAVGASLYATQVVGPTASPQWLFTQQPSLVVDQGVITFVASQYGASHLFVGTSTGQIHSVPPDAMRLQGYAQTRVVNTGGPLLGMGAAGRRVLFLTTAAGGGAALKEIVFGNVQGCMAGYIATQLEREWAGVCMQSGRGTFAGRACPAGTYGPEPAALHCEPCPPGTIAPSEGSVVCLPCDSTPFSNADGTECVAQCPATQTRTQRSCVGCSAGYFMQNGECTPCPAGTYLASGGSSCLPCPVGTTSVAGAHACVRVCADESWCAYDGQTCVSLTKNYQVLSQVGNAGNGKQMLGLAVDWKGGVFFSDGVRLQYYLDTCTSYDPTCNQTGIDLLPPNQYADYRFTALTVCNRVQVTNNNAACPTYRLLYASSMTRNNIYALRLCLDAEGNVNATATRTLSPLTLVAGVSWASFADGPFTQAAFNQPVDLELNAACDLLYVSDFRNHRIRLLNFSSQQVSTVVGSGQGCWKVGSGGGADTCPTPATMGCDPSVDQCASVQYPLGIGLSEDELTLYIAGNLVNALFAYRLRTRRLVNVCGFAFDNMAFGTIQTCNLNTPLSKGCMLHRPFDVAAFQGQLFVGVTQGITRIDEDTWVCEQVAGHYFDLQKTGQNDGIMPDPNAPASDKTSLVNMPFKMAVSEGTGVLYFADLLNGAVRRVLVKTTCQCPTGTQLLPSAHSCYNPSPTLLRDKPLLVCPDGLYALPDDWTCFRRCADVLIGQAPVQCMRLPTAPLQSVAYSQLLTRLSPPQNTLSADWYGQLDGGSSMDFASSGGLFPLTATFRQGSIAGRAPSSNNGHFVTLTFDPLRDCWSDLEAFTTYALRPQLILPGLWLACGPPILAQATAAAACQCPTTTLLGFEHTPTTPEEEASAALGPKRWQALRNAAVAKGSPGLTQSTTFVILGTAEQNAPHTCLGRAEGPCFPAILPSSTPLQLTNAFQTTWAQDGVTQIQCRMGWPAHYYCPNGYMWTPPDLTKRSCSGLTLVATCLSCLPGTFSYSPLQERQVLGGPYQCERCEPGFYASGVGSSFCMACPANTYSEDLGSTACTACSPGKYTVVPYAYTALQCVDCPPGTGNCSACVPGEYQPNQGQLECDIVPAGHFSATPNASAPVPCEPGTYQPLQGRSSCRVCAQGSVTLGAGATACTACTNTTLFCPLSIGNRCGAGCGLNRYYDWTAKTCATCPPGKLNAQDPCASDPNVCWESLRRDFYLDQSTQTIRQCPPGSEASYDKTGCVNCLAGEYSDQSSGGCVLCRAGTYSTMATSTVCLLCAPGYSNQAPGRQSCPDMCPPGAYAPINGSAECIPCMAGLIASGYGSTACQVCALDTVAPAAGMSACNVTCDTAEGFYAVQGDTACRYCANGMAINDTCRTCGLGRYLVVSTHTCATCPPGSVNLFNASATDEAPPCTRCPSPTAYALLDAMQCIEADEGFVPNRTLTGQAPCPAGTFRNRSLPQCMQCLPGFVSALDGARACTPCTLGFYASGAGSTVCTMCTGSSVSSTEGATACTSCPPGTRAVGGQACLACQNNTFSLGGTASCLPCLPPLYSAGGASACSACPAGKTWSAASNGCANCAPGAYMVPLPSYQCILCPRGKFLPFGGSSSLQDCRQCAAGSIAPKAGASACTNCSIPGTTAQADGIKCAPCAPGTYNVDGGVCVPCARGTFTTLSGSSACTVCNPGTYQTVTMGGTTCVLCPPGTISDGSTGLECRSCSGWNNSFASSAGQTQCTPRRSQCELLQYINVSYDPAQDNTCAYCVPCAPDELTLAYDTSLFTLKLLAPNASERYLSQLCPGNKEAPLYRCLSTKPVAGQYMSIAQSVGASVATSAFDPYTFHTCEDTQFDPLVVAWVPGLNVQACYFSCLYGVNLQAVTDIYRNIFNAPYAEDPTNNLFLQRMLSYKASLCLPCPTSACPLGLYRPDYHTGRGCGPPCGLSSSPCHTINRDGCTLPCTNRPPNAGYVGGGPVLGQDWCPWQCLLGFFLSDNRTTCLPCGALPPERLCNSSDYALAPIEQCLPWHTSQALCKYCPPMPFARLVGWNNATASCQYQCISGYYANLTAGNTNATGSMTCTPCHSVWLYNWTLCPSGTYLDERQCYSTGERPTCRPCTQKAGVVRASFVSAGTLDAPASCKASCAPGYHTLSESTAVYADYTDLATFPSIGDLKCTPCLLDDTRSCNFSRPCSAGFFRNASVRDGQNNSCVRCLTSRQCPAGTYAPPCTGENLTDAQCLPCPASLLVQQQFVPYGLQQGRIVEPDHCPRVCLNNHIQAQWNPLVCEPCPTTTPCLMPGVQPPLCAFTHAYWNATPDRAWWDAAHAPPFLPPYTTEPVERAGVCWACPLGTATLPNSRALCVPLPGFGSANMPQPNAKLPIPSLPSDVYVAMQMPRMPTFQVKPRTNRRRLYEVSATPAAAAVAIATTTDLALISRTAAVVPCPYGTYKTEAGEGVCNVCPEGSSTMSTGSISLSACMCKYGYYLARGACLPCPSDTFSNVSVSLLLLGSSTTTTCQACPPNTSTLGTTGATACACALGYVRANGACVLCPAGFYCPPCMDKDAQCIPSDQRACFAGAISPPGSYAITNCTCDGPGLVIASRPKDPTQLYCRTLPLGSVVVNGQVKCLPGWSAADGPSCVLCPPGTFAAVASGGTSLLLRAITNAPVCTPCPPNTYNPTRSAIGECTPCPTQRVSPVGSVSLANCSCPPGLLPVPGGCQGCLSNQYATTQPGGACAFCPPNSLAQAGAASVKDCLCMQGYEGNADSATCEPCKKGFYSTHASNTPCVACPRGSTTAGNGATRLTACGETPSLCLPGYTWRLGVGCFLA
jgi:hypothetical protein